MIYISLIKNTADFKPIALYNGFYQRSLPPKTSCHLILLRIDKSINLFPQMQIGHHGFSVRLLEASSFREINNNHKAEIDLAICQLA